MSIPTTFLGAHTYEDAWTFCYDRKYRIYAQSLHAGNIIHDLGQAVSLPVADAICRAFARRSQVNGPRIMDIISFATIGLIRAPQKKRFRRHGAVQDAVAMLAQHGITLEVIPFVYAADTAGFVLVGADPQGRYCTMPAFGPAQRSTVSTQFVLTLLANTRFLDSRAHRARLAAAHLPPPGARASDLAHVFWSQLSQRWPARPATNDENRRR